MVKNPPANAEDVRDTGLISGSGRSPEGGNGNPLQYSCLENPMLRGVWWATIHGAADLDTTEHNTAEQAAPDQRKHWSTYSARSEKGKKLYYLGQTNLL